MNKYPIEEKLRWVKLIIEEKQSINTVAAIAGINRTTLDGWVRNYQFIGSDTFYRKGWTKRTSTEKEAAVIDYLSGKESLRDICKKYKISDTRQLRQWIMKYNGHEKLKASGTGGTPIVTKGRKTTFDERIEIVQYCISNNYNYARTAEKYKVSYQQARNYTVKYESNGVDALKDHRGKRKADDQMSELERLRAENKILRAEKEHAEMEVSFLKKLGEIERRRS